MSVVFNPVCNLQRDDDERDNVYIFILDSFCMYGIKRRVHRMFALSWRAFN